MNPFFPVRVRSSFSFGRGASHVEEIVSHARSLGIPALGLADRATIAGHIRFFSACRQHSIIPLFGTELRVEISSGASPLAGWITIFAQNDTGFRNLTRLLAEIPLGDQSSTLPLSRVFEAHDGLLVLSGNREDGLLPTLLAQDPAHARQLIHELRRVFRDRFYIEIERRHSTDRHTLIEQALLRLAYDSAAPCPIIATAPIWYATPSRRLSSLLLRAIASGKTLLLQDDGSVKDPETEDVSVSLEDVFYDNTLFDDLPEAIRNSRDIFQRASYAPTLRPPTLPMCPVSGASPEEALRRACQQGLRRRLQETSPSAPEDAYTARLEHELAIILRTGFASYFLIVAEFVSWAKAKGIPVGPGRGSGAGSLAAWALGITDIDPVRHGLFFERFLNPERVSLPDFDIDFCERRRGDVLSHVVETYGADHVAAISTFAEIKVKSAIKDVARALIHPDGSRLSFAEINTLTTSFPSGPEEPKSIPEALERAPELTRAAEQDPRVANVLTLAGHILGLYRQSGTHAAGVVISDRPLPELTALHPNPEAKGHRLPQLGLDMGDAERIGLVKFDFLGLSTMTLLREAEEIIAKSGDPVPDWTRLDRDDPEILAAFAKEDTFGIFQFESAGMREALKLIRPSRFSDLVAINALFRPGPIKYIHEFAQRKHGLKEWRYPAPQDKTAPILQETYGIMVYQEQVMDIARVCAGYSLGAADVLRRAMGKKKPDEMAKQKAIFLEGDGRTIPGALALGLTREEAEALFEDMAQFAGYGFNKSHAVAYTDIAWRTMWLKIHYPHAFYCALLNIHLSDTEKVNAIREDMINHGVHMVPPHIERSTDVCTVERDKKRGFVVRYGLSGVKYISDVSEFLARRSAAQEKGGNALPRLVAEMFTTRQIEHLAAAGAFDDWLPNRRQAYEALLHLKATNFSSDTGHFFDQIEPDWRTMLPKKNLDITDWENREHRQIGATGISFEPHPITENKEFLYQNGVRRRRSYFHFMRERKLETLSGKLAFLVQNYTLTHKGHAQTPTYVVEVSEETDKYVLHIFENSCKTPFHLIRAMLEHSQKMREPLIAQAYFSINYQNEKESIKIISIHTFSQLLNEAPGFYVATLCEGTKIPTHIVNPSISHGGKNHHLLVLWENNSCPPQVFQNIAMDRLASLKQRSNVTLRRVTAAEWEELCKLIPPSVSSPSLAA